jgi:hypothetical protein
VSERDQHPNPSFLRVLCVSALNVIYVSLDVIRVILCGGPRDEANQERLARGPGAADSSLSGVTARQKPTSLLTFHVEHRGAHGRLLKHDQARTVRLEQDMCGVPEQRRRDNGRNIGARRATKQQ